MLFSFLVPCASFHLQPGKVPAGSGDPALPVVLLLAAHYKTLCRERSWPFRKLRGECHNKFWLVACRIFWRPLEGDPALPLYFPVNRPMSPSRAQYFPQKFPISHPATGQFSTLTTFFADNFSCLRSVFHYLCKIITRYFVIYSCAILQL